MTAITSATGKGAILQGNYGVSSLATAIASAVSSGTSTGGSLKSFGIDIDSTGTLSFDATAFASAYAADPAGTQSAVSQSFASALDTTATNATAPGSGTISAAITTATNQSSDLNDEIDAWSTRLDQVQTNLQTKYTAMETALARLQSQQTYLTSMFDSMTKSSGDSSSS
jgi:flagellar hook-associated protein 2